MKRAGPWLTTLFATTLLGVSPALAAADAGASPVSTDAAAGTSTIPAAAVQWPTPEVPVPGDSLHPALEQPLARTTVVPLPPAVIAGGVLVGLVARSALRKRKGTSRVRHF